MDSEQNWAFRLTKFVLGKFDDIVLVGVHNCHWSKSWPIGSRGSWCSSSWPSHCFWITCCSPLWVSSQSTHRVATAAFWRTFHHDWKISLGWWGWGVNAHPLLLYLPSRTKLQGTLQLRGKIHSPYFVSTPMYSVVEPHLHNVAGLIRRSFK